MGKDRGWNHFTHLSVTDTVKTQVVSFFVIKYFPHCTVLNKFLEVAYNYKDFKGGKWELGKIDNLLELKERDDEENV